MRNTFAAEITRLAGEDERVVLLSGDIGNQLFNDYKKLFPSRFLNCGVAEANMISVAAGMGLCGLRPVVYTIAAFATTRCFEQIRVDVCYQEAPVVIVGTGSGLSYAANGATHHACEDIAILRALPKMTVLCPADPVETRLALRAALRHKGPSYLRLGKKGEPVVHTKLPEFRIGKGIVITRGVDVCFLSTGTMLPVVVQAAQELDRRGVSAEVVSFHTVKPLDEDLLTDVFSRFTVVTTVEEHSVLGGLGGSVAEWLSDQDTPTARLVRIGSADVFLHEAGGQEYAREYHGLTSAKIVTKTLEKHFASLQSRVAV